MNDIVSNLGFFLNEFHQGAVNHIAHFVGFALFGYGLAKRNWKAILLAPIIMEIGHVYNYVVLDEYGELAISIIPAQIAVGAVFIVFFLVLLRFFRGDQTST